MEVIDCSMLFLPFVGTDGWALQDNHDLSMKTLVNVLHVEDQSVAESSSYPAQCFVHAAGRSCYHRHRKY